MTDEFRMFGYKVARCPKRFAHDWRSCPYAHPTENARRRDPREVLYCAIPCPDYKQGFCIRGEACPYAHGVYEAWLHPSRYRTQLCKDGPSCRRPVCFFAHRLEELRTPTFTWTPDSPALDGACRRGRGYGGDAVQPLWGRCGFFVVPWRGCIAAAACRHDGGRFGASYLRICAQRGGYAAGNE